MTKYSAEFKLKVVKEYFRGELGTTLLARKYVICSVGGLRGWIKEYRLKGPSAFQKVTRRNKVYSKSFKENAVKLYLTSDKSYQELSYELGIHTMGLLCTWVNHYRKYGEIPEVKKRGKKSVKNADNNSQLKGSEEDQKRIKELEQQLRYAQIEVEYLKGLRRLGRKGQMNKKLNSSTISEKNLNSKKS
ncbi:Mobile element protein [Lactococcus lactis subsp. lactis]|jgi:transposase|nr:Mobile element protein [Lactococcus lactis subsp. lactis]